jgi:5-methylcytosine-specific restriction endonuclease McrA
MIRQKIYKTHNKKCAFCGKVFSTIEANRKYCPTQDCSYNIERLRVANGGSVYRKRFKLLERDGFRCQYCGLTPADGITLRLDHIVPKAKGGIDHESNIITSCEHCNCGKGDILLDDALVKLMKKRREVLKERREFDGSA